jgi:hypothetical protein
VLQLLSGGYTRQEDWLARGKEQWLRTDAEREAEEESGRLRFFACSHRTFASISLMANDLIAILGENINNASASGACVLARSTSKLSGTKGMHRERGVGEIRKMRQV